MKIGFSVTNNRIAANALTDAENASDFARMLEEDGEAYVGYLNLTDYKSETRGDLGPAFEALRLLIEVNHFHSGSLCYAVEEMLEQVFRAGQEYERESKRETFKLIADAMDQNLEHLKKLDQIG